MKNKALVIVFVCFICFFSLAGIILPDKEISAAERRKLDKFPKFELSKDWIEDVDGYLLDHFVWRDGFRGLKAGFNYKILGKYDNNGVFLNQDYIFKSIYPADTKSVEGFINHVEKIQDLFSEENESYLMIIPDKSYYLESDKFLKLNYDYIYNEIEKLDVKHIDIRKTLELGDYYETDTHWKQEKIEKVVEKMSKVMEFAYEKIPYEEKVFDGFYGVYFGESAINRKPEKLTYLYNDIFEKVDVKYLEDEKLNTIYNEEKLQGLDAYDVYLDGANALIEITNPNALSEKELIIFRDSFGSSLAPLLVNSYKEITLVDSRYINIENLKKHVKFDSQDVLFMYSTLVVNDSKSLKG